MYAQGATSWESGQQSANLDLTVFGCEELKSSSPLRLLDGSVWVLCQPKQRGDGSPYALRIDLESFDLVQSIENADEDGLGNHRGFVQIGQTSWLAFKGHTGLSLVPITEGTNELFIEKAEWSIASRASDLTFQGFSPSTELLELVFCGNVENLSNPPQETTKAAWGPSTCRFLQYDPQDGSYVGYYDGPERRVRKKPRKLVEKSVTTESGLKFRSLWKETSKTGTIEVIDVIADEVMQSVETKAQSAVAVSPDENWLFTMGVFDHQLRAYRISETAVAE